MINLSNEYGSIGEKVAKEWLKNKGYKVYAFKDILFELRDVHHRKKSKAKYATSETGLQLLLKKEKFLNDVFNKKLDDFYKYEREIFKLIKKAKGKEVKNYKQFRYYPDFILNKNNEITFIEVKVNQAEPKKYQKVSFDIAKNYGFKVMIIKLNIIIEIQQDIQLIEYT